MAAERIGRSGEPALYRVRTDSLTLVFAPEVGGRLLSLEAHGRELLWRNPRLIGPDLAWRLPRDRWPDGSSMGSWPNLGGSKTWPAPQGWSDPDTEWAGPPDPVLDDGAYEWSCADTGSSTVVGMRSRFDARSGLRISRTFNIPHAGRSFTETIAFANESERARTWSMWEVVQVDTGAVAGGASGAVVVPSADGWVLDLGSYRGDAAARWDGEAFLVPIGAGVGKRGFPSATRSIAYHEDGRRLLELTFVAVEHAKYPDGGARAELWMQSPQAEPIAELEGLRPDAWLVELEVLSPLRTLAASDRAEFVIGWRV